MTETVTLRPVRVTDAAEMATVLAHPDLYQSTGGAECAVGRAGGTGA